MDLEAALRQSLEQRDHIEDQITIYRNEEGRVGLYVTQRGDAKSKDFVIVGNTAIPWPIVPEKPPTQRVVITEGILPAPQKGEPGYDPN